MITAEKPKSQYKNIYIHKGTNGWNYRAAVVYNGERHHLGYYPLTPQGEQDALDRITSFKNNLSVNACIKALRTGKVSEEYKLKLLEALKK